MNIAAPGEAPGETVVADYLANRLISLLFNTLYNQTLSDIETCYKMMTAEVARSLRLSADDFGAEVEISATSRASASCASTSSAFATTAAATTRARRSIGRTASRRFGTC